MNRFDRDRLIERVKIAAGAIAIGGGASFAVFELYGAWSYGTIRARRQGIVSMHENPDAFWFSVGVYVFFLAMVLAGAAFMAWVRSGVKPPRAPRPPMLDQTKIGKFDP
ncbi:hypothetical protein [Aureimonas sp. AU20]|uniref:hypothetical protein n=1 Tax=Aureimonas sp. AU20 TaxID=1349819 RepID=UPI0007201BCD|nr:hypothetical protein [Aureimonas sp. AU20]ALN71989.1 hypothetical protein M673_04630 [Aureimonas sp. AU20]